MRGRNVLVIVASALALAAAGSAGAGSNGVLASANGGYGFSGSAAGSFFAIHPFTWHVKVRADGSVTGRYDYAQVRDGVELQVSGSLNCATILGNQVWVGGLIEESSRGSLVGLDMWFQAQDNGEGANAHPTCPRRSAPALRERPRGTAPTTPSCASRSSSNGAI